MNEQYRLDTFQIENYRSICDEQILDLTQSASIIAFYGANASGKTNIFRALTVFCKFIKLSTEPSISGIPHEPFLLRIGMQKKPTKFCATFHNDSKRFRYSFAIQDNHVVEEEMYDLSSSRPRIIFIRSKGPNETSTRNGFSKKFFEGIESVRDDSLLITLAQRTKNPYANAVFNLIDGISTFTLTEVQPMLDCATDLLQKKPELHSQIVGILQKADFAIKDFTYSISKITPEMLSGAPLSDEVKEQLILTGKNVSVSTVHTVRNQQGDAVQTTTFDINRQESLGTRTFFNLIAFLIDVINLGKTVYLDEFGASLHTDICKFIINLFKNEGKNTGAKLIINTHDVGLLNNGFTGVLGKNDVVIVEKDRFEQTKLTQLSKNVKRSDENIGKKYTMGIYGGVPIFEEVE